MCWIFKVLIPGSFFFFGLPLLVLRWADILVAYVMWMLMIYLTDVWKLTITHASGIINVYMSLIATMPLVMQILVDTSAGNYWMLTISSLSCCTGMGLLSMSTSPVLSKSTGTCGNYEPECIGDTQHILFYIALVLVAVGLAGHATWLINFWAQQLMDWPRRPLSGVNPHFICRKCCYISSNCCSSSWTSSHGRLDLGCQPYSCWWLHWYSWVEHQHTPELNHEVVISQWYFGSL